MQQQRAALSVAEKHLKQMGSNQSQQITAAIIQQQNRAIAQQNMEKFSNMSSIEKQRMFERTLFLMRYALIHAKYFQLIFYQK